VCLVLLDDVGNCNVLHGHDLILSVNVFDVIIIICVCVRLRVLVSHAGPAFRAVRVALYIIL